MPLIGSELSAQCGTTHSYQLATAVSAFTAILRTGTTRDYLSRILCVLFLSYTAVMYVHLPITCVGRLCYL